jgi:rhamnosyltransferase
MPNGNPLLIVIYFPDHNLIDRVRFFCSKGIHVFIYNNSCDSSLLNQLSSIDGVVILGNGLNLGLGKALNSAMRYIYSSGFEYCLVLDQDTNLSHDAVDSIFNSSNLPTHSLLSFFSSNNFNKLSHIFINSGCLFNLSQLSDLGFHSENYFVEGVDYDLGLRALRSNFMIKKISISGLDHSTFQDTSSIHFFGHKFIFRAYSMERFFSMLYVFFILFLRSLYFPPLINYSFFFLKSFFSVLVFNPFFLLLKYYAH